LAWFFEISRSEWIAVIMAIGLVLTVELLNTSIESVVDLASPEFHQLAGQAKDVAAGAVLASSLTSASIGLFIFVPHLIEWLEY